MKNLELDYITMPEVSSDSNVGRIGYIKVCEEGEELRKPEFEIGTYENGTFIPQAH